MHRGGLLHQRHNSIRLYVRTFRVFGVKVCKLLLVGGTLQHLFSVKECYFQV